MMSKMLNSEAMAVSRDPDARHAVTVFGDGADQGIEGVLRSRYGVSVNGGGLLSGRVTVIAIGSASEAALAAVTASPDGVSRLILLSPRLADERLLALIETPTLVAVGSKDREGAAIGRRCTELMPSCYLMYVYDAGADFAVTRPEATIALLDQFMDLGETFPVRTDSNMIHP